MKFIKIFIIAFLLFLTSNFILPTSESFAQTPNMTTPQPVASTPNREFKPAIVEDRLGRIHVFSSSYGNADPSNLDNLRLFMSTYNSGTNSFGTPSQVTNLTRVGGVVALNDSTGTLNLILVKNMEPAVGGKRDLFWTKNSGSGWSTPLRLTDYADFDMQPTIVETGNGNLGVIFTRWLHYDFYGNPVSGTSDLNYDHTDFDLYQMTYTKTTDTWSQPSPVVVTPFVSEAFPSLVKGPQGRLIVIYASNEEGTWSMLKRVYNSGAWSSSVIFESGISSGYLQQPSIVNDAPGTYRLVYSHKTFCPNALCPNLHNNSTSEIRYRTYNANTDSWASVVSLTNRANFYADMPSALYTSGGVYWLVFRRLGEVSYGGDNPTANLDIYWMKSQ